MAFVLSLIVFSALQQFAFGAVPTWPNYASDELEDVMFLNTGYRSKQFAKAVTPCSSSPGPGRIAAAEWLRTSFHDMATANQVANPKTGGMDASLVYELNSLENVGSAFVSTLSTQEPFMGIRASMSDIIALGTYTAVRSCGGLPIPIRPGRIDTTIKGENGAPQPGDGITIFLTRFGRMGFNQTEMIALTACGHTLGGVHAENNPLIVAPNTVPNNFATMDSTGSVFDEKIASEYVANTTADPLVSGLSVRYRRNSDLIVFQVDGNKTIKAMADPTCFQTQCRSMLQKMIEIVPSDVTLAADPIVPYEVKPYGLQLYVQDARGESATFSGDIRVRTTSRSPASVKLVYQDRSGGNSCNNDCTIATKPAGIAAGFDDSFSFYSFSATISTSASISSFSVKVTNADGSTETFNNNGAGYPVQDTVLFQYPQSCSASSSSVTVTAAIRNSTTSTPSLNVIGRAYKIGLITPTFNTTTSLMSSGTSVGPYTLYNVTLPLDTTQSATARFNLTIPGSALDYQSLSDLPSTCSSLTAAPSTTSPSSSYTSLGCVTDPVNPRALKDLFYYDASKMTTASCAAFCSSYAYFGTEYSGECYCGNVLSPQSTNASLSDCSMPCFGDASEMCGGPGRLSYYQNTKYTPPSVSSYSGYTYQGCYTDSVSARSLSSLRTTNGALTIQLCAQTCLQGNYKYMGAEYYSECYCANELSTAATLTPDTDCGTVCSGNSSQACGGPDRLSVYMLPSSSSQRRALGDEAGVEMNEHLRRHAHGRRGVRRLFDEVVRDASK